MTPVSEARPAVVVCHPADDVAVACEPISAGRRVISGAVTVTARQNIATGHKIALVDRGRGGTVRKYGAPIGLASQAIRAGDWVHSHNLVTALSGEVVYDTEFGPTLLADSEAPCLDQWAGYRRADGRVGTRNEVWILPTVGCVGPLADDLAREARERHAGRCDGVFAFSHPHGCSQLSEDLEGTRAVLAGLADNPNAGGVLLVGFGCESNRLAALVEAVPPRSRAKLRLLRAQDEGDERARGRMLVDELVDAIADARREPSPAAALVAGLKCGGSDAWSGLTANPLLGRLSDRLGASGGTAILTEIPEIFGAESDLLARARNRAVFDAAAAMLNDFKRYFLSHGEPVSENPSPGNLAGGITTLEEKSLGAVQKGGRAPLADVVAYGGQVRRPGLALLESPGNDAVSSTALAAAGATVILFTTGRGTPLGFPVPTLKIASNSALAVAKPGWIDFDAGTALAEGLEAVDAEFASRVLAIASGAPTAAERSGNRAIAIWKRGATL